MKAKPAIFIDRDGTIIEDLHYPREADKVALIEDACEGLREMSRKGYLIVIVSNQSGVGRGIITDSEFQAVHQRCCELLQAESVEVSEFVYCFHKPEDRCRCRKPHSDFLPRKVGDTLIDLKRSFTIGDRDCDVELSYEIGATGCLVLTGKGNETLSQWTDQKRNAVAVFSNLKEFSQSLKNHSAA